MKKTILFNHLGFPIKLIDWPHIVVDGDQVPNVDYRKLEDIIFQLLPIKLTKLNGAEIKFIRRHLGMTQKRFAKWLEDETDESTISKWENADLKPSGMPNSMERSIRMQLISYILNKHRRKTVRLGEIMEKLSSSLAEKKSLPIVLSAKNYFPIPDIPPRGLYVK